ncbi:TIGR04290 family methyltransferase [Flavobacterium sp. J372]|uniref:TIGR04290 family methyltransferase n=1 Tax=Flavobacterium sp. J372 TaxID=2898436 RepID=UPI002150785A|nr:TIGR04290 family methyltransferase [Flavobacterium sp. J372]MCR5862049.1 TIGR04290 family methyltransferase [Flavobacterium sp. J372]
MKNVTDNQGSQEQLKNIGDKIDELGPWFHNIHLPDGTQTAPNHFLGDFPTFKWDNIRQHIPRNMIGLKVLDIGCNAGFYSIEMAKRGAHVVAIDLDEHYLKQARWVTEQFGMSDVITFKKMQVYDLAKYAGEFDLVLFMGVFYHLRYPLLALDIVAQKASNHFIFQTLAMPGKEEMEVPADIPFHERDILKDPAYPSMAFIEKSLAGDYTNWWVPNHQGVVSMLRSCGFTVETMPEDETYVCRKDPNLLTDFNTWNYSEYLSATGQEWEQEVEKKTRQKF